MRSCCAKGERSKGCRQHFDELVDLLPFARHGWNEMALRVGHAQFMQEGARQFEEALLVTVVRLRGGRSRRLGAVASPHAYGGLALLLQASCISCPRV